jgi:hypothetical protein
VARNLSVLSGRVAATLTVVAFIKNVAAMENTVGMILPRSHAVVVQIAIR